MRSYQDKIALAAKWLNGAERVLITAGAGLSTAAGLDYGDRTFFAKNFPGMLKLGFSSQAELVGYSGWDRELKWGYLAANVHHVRYVVGKEEVYQILFRMTRAKNLFVRTSNVDGMFEKNGFERSRIFTPQGDYALMQCQRPCSSMVWETKPELERILPLIDRSTQRVTDPTMLPICPNCGGDVMLNVRGGDWFVEEPYLDQERRYRAWLDRVGAKGLLIVEIGAGFNTPGVIRWPNERLIELCRAANFIRIDLANAEIPKSIGERSVGIEGSADRVLRDIDSIRRAL